MKLVEEEAGNLRVKPLVNPEDREMPRPSPKE